MPVEIFSKDFDRARSGSQKREDHPDRSALPCPIWPKKAKDISAVDLNIQILRSPPLAKLLA
jgi:hypothetical protein